MQIVAKINQIDDYELSGATGSAYEISARDQSPIISPPGGETEICVHWGTDSTPSGFQQERVAGFRKRVAGLRQEYLEGLTVNMHSFRQTDILSVRVSQSSVIVAERLGPSSQ